VQKSLRTTAPNVALISSLHLYPLACNLQTTQDVCRIAWDYFQLQQNCFVWRLRLKVQKLKHSHSSLEIGWSIRKICWQIQISGDFIGYWALRWQRHSETIAISIFYCAANKLRASFSRCSNAVKNIIFRSICTPMYTSQLLWCNFRKSCMERLWVAYNFGCRALYNLPWRASVSSHQVQCNIPTFEALLRKYKYLFLERCRKSNNVWLYALINAVTESDCLYLSLFFEHYNRILLLLRDWAIELCSVRLIDGVSSHNAFAVYLD